MALPSLRLAENVPGDFYVDSTCIDCDACRQIAPTVFRDTGEYSVVFHQPQGAGEILQAGKALVSCPTASIGTVTRRNMAAAAGALPELVAGDVYRCGFTSQSSFGAFSYLVRHADGNMLVDSPRFAMPLVRNIEKLGGVSHMLLTHQDDVADHEKFRQRFGCERVMHRDDVRASTTSIELQPTGREPVHVAERMVMIPTPGHTKGHAVFLYDEQFLFTGDHLAWDERQHRLYAFRSACWYSWSEQAKSMKRLLDYRFEWVLPGHGRPVHLPAGQMRSELEKCVGWMEKV